MYPRRALGVIVRFVYLNRWGIYCIARGWITLMAIFLILTAPLPTWLFYGILYSLNGLDYGIIYMLHLVALPSAYLPDISPPTSEQMARIDQLIRDRVPILCTLFIGAALLHFCWRTLHLMEAYNERHSEGV